jgi:outer membrane protein assembly factor BamB
MNASPLRIWPGVAIVAIVWLSRFGAPVVGADASTQFLVRVLGGVIGGAAVAVWWLAFSRAPWSERLGILGLLIAALATTWLIGDRSIPVWILWYGGPLLGLALVASLVATRRLESRRRRAAMAAAILLTCGAATLVKIVGVTGNGVAQFTWRWTETPEDRLVARAELAPRPDVAPIVPPPSPTQEAETPQLAAGAPSRTTDPITAASATTSAAGKPANWPGFRGADRSGVIRDVYIDTNWSSTPPTELWRRDVGPGWSSFAISGDVFYTQEQRGSDEIVSAHRVSTGEPVWRHADPVRFEEGMGGPGPRATPTVAANRVLTFGATGLLNALDAASGRLLWSRNAVSDLDAATPGWGFAASPLVVDDLVIIAAGGQLAAYALETGERRWVGPSGGDGYSSPHATTIDGVPQIVLTSATSTVGVTPADGRVLWEHRWDSRIPVLPIAQPARIDDGQLLVGDGMLGVRRIAVAHAGDGWTVSERWSSNRLKPYFNDLVVHRGHAYGFDGAILACLDLADGARKWKGGRYGQGQLVLLADQEVLVVLSEDGELALVKASPDEFTELARIPALNSKTWNHPVLAGDILLVRNGQEMAAFRLAPVRR